MAQKRRQLKFNNLKDLVRAARVTGFEVSISLVLKPRTPVEILRHLNDQMMVINDTMIHLVQGVVLQESNLLSPSLIMLKEIHEDTEKAQQKVIRLIHKMEETPEAKPPTMG